MLYHNRKRRGLTLIETIVTLAIFMILSFVAMVALVSIIRTQSRTTISSEVQGSAREMMNQLTLHIRRSKDLVTTIDSTDDCMSNCLGLRLNDESVVVFRLEDGVLLRYEEDFSSQPIQLTDPNVVVDSLIFDILQSPQTGIPPAVNITLRVNAASGASGSSAYSATQTLENTVVLRTY